MDALDGNAIAGALFEHFGSEMTTVTGACGHCGNTAQIAELIVYMKAPGAVARCPVCAKVVMVLVEIAGAQHVDLGGFDMTG